MVPFSFFFLFSFFSFQALIVRKHTRIRFTQKRLVSSRGIGAAMSRKPAEKRAARKRFQSAESFIAARDVFFCIPVRRRGQREERGRVFNFAQGHYWPSRAPIRQHVNEAHGAKHTAQVRNVHIYISELAAGVYTLHRAPVSEYRKS